MKNIGVLILFSIFTLIFYYPSLKFGFTQDDFIHLSASQANSVGEFMIFFNPLAQFPDIFFYRPLSTQVYFFLNNSLFGLNPLPYHIEALILQIINSLLFCLIINKLWKNKKIAFLSASLYSISAIHFLSIYYISAFQEVARIFFIFLTVYLFILFRESGKRKFFLVSIISFITSLLCKETSVILPFLLIPIEALRSNNSNFRSLVRSVLKPSVIYFLIVFFYALVRILGFQNIFHQGDYQLTFSLSDIFQNFKWYLLWSFGLPEVLSNYPNLKSGLLTFRSDFQLGFIIISSFIVTILTSLYLFITSKKSKNILLPSLAIFIISLIPVLVLHGHKYPQYLDLAFLGLLPILASLFLNQSTSQFTAGMNGSQKNFPKDTPSALLRGSSLLQTNRIKKGVAFIFIASFIILQYSSLKLSETSHYITHRSLVAEHYYDFLKKDYPELPKNTTIIFEGSDIAQKELSVSLANHYAISVWYPDTFVNIRYQQPELDKPPGSITIPILVF